MGGSSFKLPLSIGVDLGGTKVEMALVDSEGQILSENRYPTNPEEGSSRFSIFCIPFDTPPLEDYPAPGFLLSSPCILLPS